MNVTKKTYAEFTESGLIFSETEVVEVKSREVQNLEIPKSAYCLRFFDIIVTTVSNGKERVKAKSRPVNYSPLYFVGTKIYTKKKMAEETDKEKGLSRDILERRSEMMREMIVHKLKYALKCQVGGFIMLRKGELVLLLAGKERKVVKVC